MILLAKLSKMSRQSQLNFNELRFLILERQKIPSVAQAPAGALESSSLFRFHVKLLPSDADIRTSASCSIGNRPRQRPCFLRKYLQDDDCIGCQVVQNAPDHIAID